MAAPGKATGGGGTEGTGELVFGDGGAPTGGGTGGGVTASSPVAAITLRIYGYNKYATYFRFISYKIRYCNSK
jgi:hypothetical protein